MRLFIAALAALWMVAPALAAQHPDDRYFDSRAMPIAKSKVKVAAHHKKQARPHRRGKRVPRPRAKPDPGSLAPIGLLQGAKREALEAMPRRWLIGIVPPLAAKAREICNACGSKVISGIRHTYVAGTGGRLSLHASGRAVDIKGNPACIYAHLHGWPGGYSVDYGRVQHVHISYAPRGPEWGARFTHYGGRHRKRHVRRRA